jgi:hypothetical protein
LGRALKRVWRVAVARAWKVWAVAAVRQSAAADAAARETLGQRRVLLAAVSRLAGQQVSLAFSTWRVAAARARESAAAAAALETQLRAGLECMGAAAAQCERTFLARALRRWQHAAVRLAAFQGNGAALTLLEEGRRAAEAHAGAAKKQFAARRLQWTLAAGLQNRCRAAMAQWRGVWRATQTLLRSLARLALDRRRRTCASALGQWRRQGSAREAQRRAATALAARRCDGVKHLGAGVQASVAGWALRAAARAFRVWAALTLLAAQRELLVAESLELLRDKALYNLRTVALRNAAVAKGRAFAVWLARANSDRQTALSYSLLRLSLRNQCGLARRGLHRCLGRALRQWRLGTLAEALELAGLASVRAARSLGRAWRTWTAQVWSHRCLVQQERAARKALSELKQLHAVASAELLSAKQALQSPRSPQAEKGQVAEEGRRALRGRRQVKRAFDQWAQDTGLSSG